MQIVSLQSAVSQMDKSTKIVKKAVATILDVLKMEAFAVRSVKEFVWGYDDPLIKLAKGVLPADKRFPFDQFGFFVGKNNTPSEVFTVFTGRENLQDFAKIQIYGGKENLGVWGTEACNALTGSDGSGFPAMLNENSSVYIFQSDFCRPIELVVKSRTRQKHEGFETLRFQPADHVFGSVDEFPENKCFCDNAQCSPKGTFNVSLCQFSESSFPRLVSNFRNFYDLSLPCRLACISLVATFPECRPSLVQKHCWSEPKTRASHLLHRYPTEAWLSHAGERKSTNQHTNDQG